MAQARRTRLVSPNPEKESDTVLERKLRLYEEQRFVTSRIGETSRFIGFGVLAMFYAVVTSDSPYATGVVTSSRYPLYLSAIGGAATILFDYLQYLAGERAVTNALGRNDGSFRYNDRWWSYRLRRLFYRLKQATALLAAITVLYIVASTLDH